MNALPSLTTLIVSLVLPLAITAFALKIHDPAARRTRLVWAWAFSLGAALLILGAHGLMGLPTGFLVFNSITWVFFIIGFVLGAVRYNRITDAPGDRL